MINFNAVLSALQAGDFIDAGLMLKQCHPNFSQDWGMVCKLAEACIKHKYGQLPKHIEEATYLEYAGWACDRMELDREALFFYSQITPATDEERARLFYIMGISLCRMSLVDMAEFYLMQSFKLDPKYKISLPHLACSNLNGGQWPKALSGYELRWEHFEQGKDLIGETLTKLGNEPIPLTHEILTAMITGNAPKETIMVYGEQGLGDYILFLRYIQHLQGFGLDVHFMIHKLEGGSFYVACHRLLTHYTGINKLFKLGTISKATRYIAPLLSLPFLCQTRLSNGAGLNALPPPAPITIPESLLAKVRNQLSNVKGAIFACGYRGNPKSHTAKKRHIPLALMVNKLVSLMPEGKGAIILLQPNLDTEEQQFITEFQANHSDITLFYPLEGGSDLMDSLAWIALSDAVFSIDTALVHLAANQNCCPVYLFLHTRAEWRWLIDHINSPWYPCLTIHRQHQNESWEAMLDRFTPSDSSTQQTTIAH